MCSIDTYKSIINFYEYFCIGSSVNHKMLALDMQLLGIVLKQFSNDCMEIPYVRT